MSDCNTCVVRNRSICSALNGTEIAALSAITRMRTLAAGESLAWEGQEALLLANVVAGVLKLSSPTPDGREQIVGVVYPSDFIGRPFGGATPFDVVALTEARVCMFARSDFDRLAQSHPALEKKLLERTLDELDRTRRWMLLLGRKSAPQKLASFLLEMSERLFQADCDADNAAPQDHFELPFSRQQIADILGLTIETVSRQFSRLTAGRAIRIPSRRAITILNRAALELQAG